MQCGDWDRWVGDSHSKLSQSHSILSSPAIFNWGKIKFHSQTLRLSWHQSCPLTQIADISNWQGSQLKWSIVRLLPISQFLRSLSLFLSVCLVELKCFRPCHRNRANCFNLKMCPAPPQQRGGSAYKKNILLVTGACQRAVQKLEIAACYEML